MGGNGRHTNFRETSLARARWQPDKFAAMVSKRGEENSLLTTCKMKFQGDSLEILAEVVDKAKPVLLESQIHRVWTEDALPGFSFEESQVSETKDGWKSIRWPKGFGSLAGTSGCIKLKFKNLKIWAMRGDICLDGHRLWEGADMENEGY